MIGSVLDNILDQEFNKCARRDELDALTNRLDQLEKNNKRLQNGIVEFERQIYYIKDLAELLGLESSTIRKNYIQTGKIKATKYARGWEISREEYLRVMHIVKTYGINQLQEVA